MGASCLPELLLWGRAQALYSRQVWADATRQAAGVGADGLGEPSAVATLRLGKGRLLQGRRDVRVAVACGTPGSAVECAAWRALLWRDTFRGAAELWLCRVIFAGCRGVARAC